MSMDVLEALACSAELFGLPLESPFRAHKRPFGDVAIAAKNEIAAARVRAVRRNCYK
jgi:hypothetical protein